MCDTCAVVFTSKDLSSGLTAFQDAAYDDWEFVSTTAVYLQYAAFKVSLLLSTAKLLISALDIY